ncbi:PadR family transcriptional regulator [bacterium]|nr:PadR family transcriptional regulator [bacterium]
MIEILILYVIRKREKTLYGIRKEIIELFGTFTKPSIGTIYPALKRLLKEDAISVYDKMSDGGKKSSYFSITKKGFDVFKKYFFDSASDNPSLFHTQLQARIGTMELLKFDDRKEFIKDTLRKIEIYQLELERKMKDEFIEFDYFQEQLLQKTLKELLFLKEFILSLEINK